MDAGSVGADVRRRAGQWIEPSPVSALQAVSYERRSMRTTKPVVPAVVATAKLSRRCGKPDRATCIANLRGDGDKKEFVTEEITA